VTNRCRRRVLGSSRASALSRARSAQVGQERVTCRRTMLTWWRSTQISAVLDASDRRRSAHQALSWQKIRYTSRNVTHTDHAEPNPTHITPDQHSGRVSGTHKGRRSDPVHDHPGRADRLVHPGHGCGRLLEPDRSTSEMNVQVRTCDGLLAPYRASAWSGFLHVARGRTVLPSGSCTLSEPNSLTAC
jgi:hypothetical protein